MIWLMESVRSILVSCFRFIALFALQAIEETHKEIEDTIERVSSELRSAPTDKDELISVDDWLAAWQTKTELLNVLSVMGMRSLIEFASATSSSSRSPS